MPPHSTYVEPFAGAANVLLAKPPSQKEVINDLDSRVVKIHKALRVRPSVWQMRGYERKWLEIHAKPPSHRTGFEEAYLLANSFGGRGQNYATRYGRPLRTEPVDTTALHDRLTNVKVLNKDFASVMSAFDSPKTLHYLDPPYVAGNDLYAVTKHGSGVTPERVATVADRMKGNVMVSYDDNPEVRRAFRRIGWRFNTIANRRSLQGGNRYVRELLITNYIP